MDANLSAIFRSNWNIYQKIFTYNYMRHREMAVITRDAILNISIPTPLHVLDFGCGDARPISPQLQIKPVAVYTGYDLSEAALAQAKKNLAEVNFDVRLRQAPMQTFTGMENSAGSFEIIHSSYAIHHLQDDEKQQLLADCYYRLSQGGVMIIIDVFRNEGQSRDTYIEEYINYIKATWQMISEDEKQQVATHMRSYDFPARTNEMAAWADSTGFGVNIHKVDELHTALVLHRSKN